jgi:hypothetical protein
LLKQGYTVDELKRAVSQPTGDPAPGDAA